MSGTSKQTVYTWLDRYQVYGVDGLVSESPRDVLVTSQTRFDPKFWR